MSAKFTPGPWITEKRAGDEWWFGGAGGAEIVIRSAIGKSYDSVAVLGAQMNLEGVDDANARLIAAAPMLLEALDSLMELERRGRLMPIGREWDAARAAIAAATGENRHE